MMRRTIKIPRNPGNSRNSPGRSHEGFTIIELLIATAVFSMILIVITAAILQFSKQYYKGVVSSTTQGAARTLIDDITRSIQFNGGGVTPMTNGYCVGSAKRYSYVLGKQVIDSGVLEANQKRHGLVSDRQPGCGSGALAVGSLPARLDSPSINPALDNPRELLGQRMRLARFDIKEPAAGVYSVRVKVVYGDDDLLTNPTSPTAACKSTVGSQFCAVSELSTTVTKRVN